MRTHFGRNLISIAIILCLLTTLATADDDDFIFQHVPCSTCIFKDSVSDTQKENNAVSSLIVAVDASLVADVYPVYSGKVPEPNVLPPSSNVFFAYTNKAPPIQL